MDSYSTIHQLKKSGTKSQNWGKTEIRQDFAFRIQFSLTEKSHENEEGQNWAMSRQDLAD